MNISPRFRFRCLLLPLALASLVGTSAMGAGQLRLGPQLEYVHYSEPGIMDEKGALAGLFVEGDFPLGETLGLHLFSSFVAGELTYKTNPDLALDLKTTTPNTIFDLRGELTYRLSAGNVTYRPYIGLGYRRLVDDLPDIGIYQGYKREQVYAYVPLGMELVMGTLGSWSCSARGEYDLFLGGENTSDGLEMDQENGWGAQGSLSLRRGIDWLGFDELSVVPFVQYWDIDRSEITGPFWEPQNTSTMIGLRIALSL
jgi:hypothetical protein